VTVAPGPSGNRVLGELEERGILLVTDPALPSVTGIVAGEAVTGSWWTHPRSQEMYAVLSSLEAEQGVLVVKLIEGKQTLVHRKLWPQLLALATSREGWQTDGLSARARALLEKVEKYGAIRLDQLGRGFDRKALSRAARELEERLLVHGDQAHTERGTHQKFLSSWGEVGRKLHVRFAGVDVSGARAAFEARTKGKLPWQRRTKP
jgi:hypothetical protein